jgi:phosphatidylinositol glycan class S
MKDIFNFTIESQILYHAPLTFEPVYGRIRIESEAPSMVEAIQAAEKGDAQAEEVVKADLEKGANGNEGAWLIGEEEMRGFINSERWSLGGSGRSDVGGLANKGRFWQFEQSSIAILDIRPICFA